MILDLVQNGPLVWPTMVEENGTTRKKKYKELSVTEKLQADCDLKATNIVLQGLPPDVYVIINHHKIAKEILYRVKLLMQGTKLSLQERESNRIVLVLSDLVNEVQSAFVTNRQILDGPFILNEIIQWCKHKKKHSFIFKMDFEKAYDSVRWDYLDDILKRFGFGHRWCDWIQECLRSSKGSVLVNGSPTEEFQFFKGLKQGDPLSPFLFILVMESLHLSFKRVVDAGKFNGLNINLCKSNLMGIAVPDENINAAAARIGCGTLNIPFYYLGAKVGGCMSKIQSWNEIVDKMVKRLSKWKMKTLSIGGQLTLLRRCLVGNGWNTRFWEDCWRGEVRLKDKFPRMYALEKNKGISVANKLEQESIHFSFRRHPWSGAENEQWVRLLESFQGVMLSPVEDRWSWSLTNSGEFSVASVRKAIDNKYLPTVSSKTRWIKEVPIKINIHVWKVRLNGLPTRWNLSRRGMNIPSISCPICDSAVESSRHVFFDCCVVKDILRKICNWWNVNEMEGDTFEGWASWILNLRLSSKHKRHLEGVCFTLWWFIWAFRNKKVFGTDSPSKSNIFDDIVLYSFYWCRYRCRASFSWVDWLKNPHLVSL
nr:RNA-directed DNA polymerase, eukaryota [Tanacetum cinerariifolium]